MTTEGLYIEDVHEKVPPLRRGVEFLKNLFYGLEKNPGWIRRVSNVTEAAATIMDKGVRAVGFERRPEDVPPDISAIKHMELGLVLGFLKEFMEYRDAGGVECTSLSDFFLSDEGRRKHLETFHEYDLKAERLGGGGLQGFMAEKELAEPFFLYVEKRVRELLAAMPDYELNKSPEPKRAEHTPYWHVDKGKMRHSPKRDFINVLINIYGKPAEFALDERGRQLQTFGEGATTMHWGGEDGAWHRSPLGKEDRLSVALILSRKKEEKK